MSNTLTDDFERFVKEISLDKSKVDDIIAKHNGLTDMIKSNPPDGYSIKKSRLSGSYAKHTVLNEYDKNKKPDVDVIVILDGSSLDVDKVNKDFFNYFQEKKATVVSEIRQQSNSIGLIYSNIGVDIVLALDSGNNNISIASNKMHDWIDSNALKHVEYMEKQNGKYEAFSYYSLMKLFKYLNKEIFKYKLKSFTLEQLVHQCAPAPKIGLRLYQAFEQTINNIANLGSIDEIRDCCDESKKGYDEKDKPYFNLFLTQARDYSKLASDAVHGDRTKWEEIFGDRFPKQPSKKVINEANYDKKQTPWCY